MKKESIDWQKIIDNRCPCWFWDDFESNRNIGFLVAFHEDDRHPYESEESIYKHCEPAKRLDVTFYEDIEK